MKLEITEIGYFYDKVVSVKQYYYFKSKKKLHRAIFAMIEFRSEEKSSWC